MTRWKLRFFFLAVLVLALAGGTLHFFSRHSAQSTNSQSSVRPTVSPVSLPMFFEANEGQTDSRVKFLARGSGYALFLTSDGAVLKLSSRGRAQFGVIGMRLAGGNSAAKMTGAEPFAGKSNYFIGNDPKKWHRNIPQFGRVEYQGVYPGIDLAYYGQQGRLEYDFRVAPGADPNQIAMIFDGAAARLDSGDLVLATGGGEVRFRAPRLYQVTGNQQQPVAGGYRVLADNKIGFQIAQYDRSRELVIDPVLNYSTFLGGTGVETEVHVALGADNNIYVAGTTSSPDFPTLVSPAPFQGPQGGLDVFIAKINPAGALPAQQLVYATYLGGSGDDHAAGIAVDTSLNVYVAGTTTSPNFPPAGSPFQSSATGTHGFLSRFSITNNALSYSTYLAGNGADIVTGLALDNKQDAFVTGTTTSTNDSSNGFPSTGNGLQLTSNDPGGSQFFASKINTNGTGTLSMLYSTYFGGGFPAGAQTLGGGIAVDTSGNMYITGGTNFIGVTGPNGEAAFPMLNSQQVCLNQPGVTTNCTNNTGALDAFAAKINPNRANGASLVYSTFLGGGGDDIGFGIAADASGNTYVTGQTTSTDWNVHQNSFLGGPQDAFVAKVTNPSGSNTVFPLTFFQYVGGAGTDIGRAIAVDSVQAAHITGSTDSPGLGAGLGGSGAATDAFVALIPTAGASGTFTNYLGGSGFDQGTGIALDTNLDSSPTIVAGETESGDFPLSSNPFQSTLHGTRDAFVASVGGSSGFTEVANFPTVSPKPASVGNQVTFTFEYVNNGPDPASNVIFSASLPASAAATFNSGSASPGGACPSPVNNKLTCTVGNVAVNAQITITVVLTPVAGTTSMTVTPSLSANGGAFQNFLPAQVDVNDFSIGVSPASVTVKAGETASYVVTLTPLPSYSSSISVAFTSSPSLSGTTGTFNPPSPITLSGGSPATTTLNIATTARPVNQAQLFRGGMFYALWLPIGGLSLAGIGLRRRRWVIGAALVFVAGIILLQAACGSSSNNTTPTTGTQAGTYTITMTGTSGSVSHNKAVTLVVQ